MNFIARFHLPPKMERPVAQGALASASAPASSKEPASSLEEMELAFHVGR